MRPSPRADYILRWRYAIVAESLRNSARDTEDSRRAYLLLKIADHYTHLAAMPQSEKPAHLRVVAGTGDVSRNPPWAPPRGATRD
jgi:hypothetical protein